ncbi:putative Protein of unknown function (DUF3154) [Vibrio phage 275E43-1]|nr:putative Protein of unknown function (DUF3154) [Vibrio phage 275E43-1]
MIISEIVGGLFKLGKGWLEGKQKTQAAKQEKEMQIINNAASWDEIQAKGSQTSWKDEYLTIVLSIPLIMCFIPEMNEYVESGFKALEGTPEWYQYLVGVVVAASFGIKKVTDVIGQKTKK